MLTLRPIATLRGSSATSVTPLVTLGTAMNLMAVGGAENSAGLNEGMSGGELTTTFQFRFVEADGVTPAPMELVSDAPEPSTEGLIGLSLAGAALLRKKLALFYLPQLSTLSETLGSWGTEIAAMWRFLRDNGISEGFHTKMEVLQRQGLRL